MPLTPPVRPRTVLGDRNEHVTYLQRQLCDKAFHCLAVTGEFNDVTEHSVRFFQKSRRLTPDGIVGERTWYEVDLLS